LLKSICISHSKDVDGLICAALLKNLMELSIKLISYDKMEEELKNVEPPTERLFICDLGIKEGLYKEIERITNFAKVTIIDHHPISKAMVKKLELYGGTLVHSTLDCASVLLFDHFKTKLGRNAFRLAVYAAISDQFEDGPIASNLLDKIDKQFSQHEALILTHSLNFNQTFKFRLFLVEELSKYSIPHKIKGTIEAAINFLENTVKLLKTLPRIATKHERIAYTEGLPNMSNGVLASLLIETLDVDVGICFRRGKNDLMNFSIRGRRGLKIHLGEITNVLATRYGGFGGGHKSACGASIPILNYLEFIKDLEIELENIDR
jgi:oligoribonuclease NrnB/cAMP/cGMP phosphodiesterase (DHH superfamily)